MTASQKPTPPQSPKSPATPPLQPVTAEKPAATPPKDTAKSGPQSTPKQVMVLAGNPNVGKSVIFNALTGSYTTVSNYPGTTVDIPKGIINGGSTLLQDTPGVYGLSSLTEEESVAQQSILAADFIINVVSALSLERDLFLTQQLIDYGKPLVLVVNQMDEARKRHITLDLSLLEKYLGVPVLPCIAIENHGIDAIREAIRQAETGNHPPCGNPTPDCPAPDTLAQLEEDPGTQTRIYGLRRQHVNAVCSHVAAYTDQKPTLSQTLGQWFLNPIVGALSGVIILLSLYQIVGVWIAGDLVDFTEGTIMLDGVIPAVQSLLGLLFAEGSIPYRLLGGEFGVLTMSIQYIFGVLFPLVLGFYIYVSVLEDCGYLPRIAVLLDGALSKIGLNGRAVIPLIIGLGCVTMATVSTRVLTTQRERTITTALLAITVPCSAQLGVIIGLMAITGGLKAWLVYMAILFTILVVLGSTLNHLLPGKSTPLVLDLPPMRMPCWRNVARKTWVRTVVFLKEAAPLFLLGSLLVSVMQVTGFLTVFQQWLSPITQQLLHLPGETAQAFVMGTVRRDFGAAGLYYLADRLTAVQLMTALIVITLFVPCIASVAVIWKERGLKECAAVFLSSWLIAFAAGALLCRLLAVVPIL